MTDKCKPEFNLWGKDNTPGRDVARIAWTGTKAVCVAVVAGVAVGLGIGAVNSASG